MEKKINYNYIIIAGIALIIAGYITLYAGFISSEWKTTIQIFQSLGFFALGIGVLRKQRLEKNLEKAKKLRLL